MAVLVAACSGTEISAAVISTANTIGVGEQRILVEFSEDPGAATATLRDENGSPLDEVEGRPVIVGERTVLAFYVDIPEAETYQLTIGDIGPLGFVAVDDPVQVTVGERAPAGADQTVVLASPAHCPSETCDDMIDLAGDGHLLVEVFEDPTAEEPVLNPEIEAWGIPGQPWLYVVDADGIVTALFEGAVSESELLEALESG